ncbi:MAG: hypothetical protein WCI51_20710 [Lentisphaerota bacterium]
MNTDNNVQLEFDLDSTMEEQCDSAGYDAWHSEQRRVYGRVADTWHLPLHRKVRVKLKWRPDELQGVLVLQAIPEQFSSKVPLKLRVDFCDFDSTEIEYCKRIE